MSSEARDPESGARLPPLSSVGPGAWLQEEEGQEAKNETPMAGARDKGDGLVQGRRRTMSRAAVSRLDFLPC